MQADERQNAQNGVQNVKVQLKSSILLYRALFGPIKMHFCILKLEIADLRQNKLHICILIRDIGTVGSEQRAGLMISESSPRCAEFRILSDRMIMMAQMES
ncbi:hypothetical protein [Paenibacillus sp. NPDC058174]|uniref:hypothetical protein n=1 Tax=Paenibacillus sp. NPDC058174 TaxID=3346366 RepID=UPI0036DAE279